MASEKGEPGLRRPRWWLRVLVVCWIAGVAFYWWHFVPAVPEKVIKYKPGQMLGGYMADALLFTHTGGLDYFRDRGPVDVVDLKTAAVLRSFGNDRQIFEHAPGVNHVLLNSPEKWELVDASTGGVVITRRFDSPNDGVTLSSDGNRVAVNSGDRVSMFDVQTGEQLWSRQFRDEEPISVRDEQMPREESKVGVMTQFGQFVRVYTLTPEGSFMSTIASSWWLNSRTGEPDPRFRKAGDLIESPDGRYVLFEAGEESQIFSLDENRVVGRIPVVDTEYSFSRDSSEVRELSLSDDGPHLSRWSVPDGKAVGAVSTNPDREILSGWISEDGRRFAVCEVSEGLFGSTWLFEELKRIGLARFVDSWNRIRQRAVLRTADGRSTRLLASDGWFQDEDPIMGIAVQPLGRDDCFAVAIPEGLLIFSSDPPRDWWWLVGWGLGPVVVIFVRAKLRGLRGRRSELSLVKESERHAQSA